MALLKGADNGWILPHPKRFSADCAGIAIFAWRLDQATKAFYIGGGRFRQRSSQEAADAESRRQGNREIAIDNYEVQIEKTI